MREALIARRDALEPEPRGDLLQAGPLLAVDGEVAYDPEADEEGFEAAAHQFDPPPTEGRHPRAALGLAGDRTLAVVCDGRARDDAGLTLVELARLMVGLGVARLGRARRRSRAAGRSPPRWCWAPDSPGPRPGMFTAWSRLVHSSGER